VADPFLYLFTVPFVVLAWVWLTLLWWILGYEVRFGTK
jgi:hypothetical protein